MSPEDGKQLSSSTGDCMERMSERYVCKEDACKLCIGDVLFQSKYAGVEATSVRDLAEKVLIASNPKYSKDEKDKILVENDTTILKPEVKGNHRSMEACWKAVIAKCRHRRDAFKDATGKQLDDILIENIESALCMIAHVNHVRFLPSSCHDTVVVGGTNAQKLAQGIHGAYWSMQSVDEAVVRGQVVFGEKIKQIIFFPPEELVYAKGIIFNESTNIMLEILNQLEKLNHSNLIMLPVLRQCNSPAINEQFTKWFKDASKEARLVGTKEIDSKQLIHWLQSTPLDRTELQYVNANGILTELGVIKLVEYLNGAGYQFKVKQHLVKSPKTAQNFVKRQSDPSSSSAAKRRKALPFHDQNQKKCFVCQAPDHIAKLCPHQSKLQEKIPKNTNYRGR